MHHWCNCPHLKFDVIHDYRENKIDIRLYAEDQAVRKALYHLYGTLSGLIHFKAGEEYPIKFIPFANQANTLAMITFLSHYQIPLYVNM
jgi:hypothetical protein